MNERTKGEKSKKEIVSTFHHRERGRTIFDTQNKEHWSMWWAKHQI